MSHGLLTRPQCGS